MINIVTSNTNRMSCTAKVLMHWLCPSKFLAVKRAYKQKSGLAVDNHRSIAHQQPKKKPTNERSFSLGGAGHLPLDDVVVRSKKAVVIHILYIEQIL